MCEVTLWIIFFSLDYSAENELFSNNMSRTSHGQSHQSRYIFGTYDRITYCSSILSGIAKYSTDSSQTSTLLGLFSPLLRTLPKIVAEKVKVDLAKTTGDLMRLIPDLRYRQTSTYQENVSSPVSAIRSRQQGSSLINQLSFDSHLGLQQLPGSWEG